MNAEPAAASIETVPVASPMPLLGAALKMTRPAPDSGDSRIATRHGPVASIGFVTLTKTGNSRPVRRASKRNVGSSRTSVMARLKLKLGDDGAGADGHPINHAAASSVEEQAAVSGVAHAN